MTCPECGGEMLPTRCGEAQLSPWTKTCVRCGYEEKTTKTKRCGRCGAKTKGRHAIGFRSRRWARLHRIVLCEDCAVSYYIWYGSGKSQNRVFCDKSCGESP